MAHSSDGLDHGALLSEVSWIRRLARELVADRDLADDLVQETCIAALEHAPRERSKLRQWLAQVLRNALRQRARADGRRGARERGGAKPEALEATDRLVERVALQRELVGAVLELEEPYRSTILQRFFEELPPRAIAERAGLPVATIQSRLTRGLARLRARLDEEHGPNGAWALVFLPWTRELVPPAPIPLFPLVMKTKLTLSVAATALVAGALVWWSAGDDPARGAQEEAPAPLARSTGDGGAGAAAPSAAVRPAREGLARPQTSAPTATPAPLGESWQVRLRVLDAEGLPLAGLAVRANDAPEVLGTSTAGGWCLFETRAEALRLVAADARWVTIHEGTPVRASSYDPVLVAAPALELAGSVVDEAGRALAGASVQFRLPRGFRTRFSEVLEATVERSWRTLSDAEGRFHFEGVPAVREAQLNAVLAGYDMDERLAPETSDLALELVLYRPRSVAAGALRGQILDPSGAFVPGARVGLGLASVTSDERGEFSLSLARALTTDELVATKAGYLPARLERPAEPDAESSGWPEHVVLVLGGPALALRGRVVDHEGVPVSGARLWLHDPTPGAPIGRMPTTLEGLMAGAEVPARALESQATLPAEDGDGFSDSWSRAGAPNALWNHVTTDGSGAFELVGLEARRYRLDVLRPGSLEVVTSDSFSAGADEVVVRLSEPDEFPEVRGRIVDADGRALADVEVELFRPLVDVTARVFGGQSRIVLSEYGSSLRTGVDGSFRFERVPRSGASLTVRGDDIVPTKVDVGAAELEVVIDARCHLEVVLRDPVARFDRIEVSDEDGQGLDLMVLTSGSTQAWTDVELVEGRSGVLSVSSRARNLRFFKDGALAATFTLDLRPGEVNRLEF
jgi:RNA polymerase sigma-70 factor (ECF subfamily)